MLTVTDTASEHLRQLLAKASDDAVIRVAEEDGKFGLEIGTVQPGDTTFNHEEQIILAIDSRASELLADRKLGVKGTGEESELILIHQLAE